MPFHLLDSGSRVPGGNGIDFPAAVNFAPARVLTPAPAGFPPAAAQSGAIGEPGYSPLIRVMFRGQPVVLNAPHAKRA